jgi:hypothetical protein
LTPRPAARPLAPKGRNSFLGDAISSLSDPKPAALFSPASTGACSGLGLRSWIHFLHPVVFLFFLSFKTWSLLHDQKTTAGLIWRGEFAMTNPIQARPQGN